MSEDEFERQVERLCSQWPNAYGPERKSRLWRIWKNVPVDFFSQMVDRALDTMRSAPLPADFAKLEVEVMNRRTDERISFGVQRAGVSGLLYAAKNKTRADKEFVQACLRLFSQRSSMTSEEYEERCKELERVASTIEKSQCQNNA